MVYLVFTTVFVVCLQSSPVASDLLCIWYSIFCIWDSVLFIIWDGVLCIWDDVYGIYDGVFGICLSEFTNLRHHMKQLSICNAWLVTALPC